MWSQLPIREDLENEKRIGLRSPAGPTLGKGSLAYQL